MKRYIDSYVQPHHFGNKYGRFLTEYQSFLYEELFKEPRNSLYVLKITLNRNHYSNFVEFTNIGSHTFSAVKYAFFTKHRLDAH